MSGDERKLVDTAGEYLYAVRNGEEVADPQWHSCRLVVTDRRLVLANDGGNRTLPHSNVELVTGGAVPDDVEAAGATPLRIGDDVVLFDAPRLPDFEREYCRATLHGEVVLANHPAVVDDVVGDVEWRKARFQHDGETVRLEFPGGEATSFAVDDVGAVETTDRTVMGAERTVLEVEHADGGDRSVETHFSGMERHTRALGLLFERVVEAREGDYELTEAEKQVLMGLYSGVSPFEMADFAGLDVDEVEEIYRTLLDVGAVDEVRTRTEVALNARGRNMASESMSEQ